MLLDQSIGGGEVLIEVVVFKCFFSKLGTVVFTCGKTWVLLNPCFFPSDLIGKLFLISPCGHFFACSF